MRPFRFGYQARGGSADELRDQARRAEAAGFDLIHTYDHLSPHWSPTLPLLAMAEATTRLRVCPLVINNDFHHPALLAAEYANLDQLTGGRVELGIGAGHSFTEYAAMGLPFDSPRVRKARLAEAVEVLRRLFDGETVSCDGQHYQLHEVRTMRSLQQRLPIMVGVNGPAALAHAAQHADTIGLMMLGRTLADGQSHEVRWEADRLDRTIAHIRSNAHGRDVELNALVQRVKITDDREAVLREDLLELDGLSFDDAAATPFLAYGTHDEIAVHLLRCRERWGISYFSVRSIDDFQPVIERLRMADSAEAP
ncbi:MAG: TIGR03621 family F420-dependent LLM class oxidoreductase [Ilumatobacteraceae bacterium]|jgi:probable F420-dependent oxidoreductase|nr:TIGR03621 family F420-dependent LLM class oxidoreductase [Acidimicrobiaceae bacterium]MBP6486506.1 TIGR03621 family F420-dependent LLM class oxidoreductase [Ilumatobacteraceae bacterium]MBP7888068.1 TIGR03621 family F420-dependent LLM class oxidoreductase [Ilumatobacteraceae bacterium]MBP8211189.1 TIGR03621 family F420-dependent LLM class oxidoreductase [Ilumatobacteraceae bacterium]MBP9053222.1 TIGR03621 family F420-dependent LLM class oxidoreductase [Ilumatobacteraceae bacterium]